LDEVELFEKEFGLLGHLVYSDKELANSMVTGGLDGKNHWTLSTKSECEEDRATKFSLHLKRVKKFTMTSLKEH